MPPGLRGTKATLEPMARIVREAKKTHENRTRALGIIRNVPPKHYRAEVIAVQAWVRRNIRYTRDIRGIETLATPEKTVEYQQGDCDDQAMVVSALLEAVGHPTRFKAVGFVPHNYSHVFCETRLKGDWVSVETTENVPIGWLPQGINSIMTVTL